MLKIITFFFIYSVTSWARPAYTTPTKVTTEEIKFVDDLDLLGLDVALDQQIASFKRSSLDGTIKLGSTIYQRKVLLDSALLLKDIFGEYRSCLTINLMKEVCIGLLNTQIKQKFNIYKPNILTSDPEHLRDRPALYTAYYSPDFIGSKTKSDRFKHAIYSLPKEEENLNLTRVEIDFEKKLEGKGYELFYVDDLFDLYLFHIEGGGRVTIFDEQNNVKSYYLSYSGKSDKSFSFISRYMMAQGMITDPSTIAQRNYLKDHPEKAQEIFSTCPGYIYFKITDHPPLGVNDIPLTDNRSLAMDSKLYAQKGLITYVVSKKPIAKPDNTIGLSPFSRFYLDQDTGGAIKGKARADLYFGFGADAEIAANHMKQTGEMYFLIKKPTRP